MEEIMLYQEFKEKLLRTLREKLFPGEELRETIIRKENKQPLTGISIRKENPGEIEIAPTIYVEELYEEYFKSPDFNRIVKEAEEMLHTEFPINYNLRNLHPDEMKKHTERIICVLIGVQQNQELLASVPHRLVCQDMAVIYRYIIGQSEQGMFTATLRNPIDLGMTPDALYEKAIANTQRMFPEEVISPVSDLSMVTNQKALYGATVILYPNVLEQLAERYGGNLYLLPSSVHEFIVVPDDGMHSVQALQTMVREINKNEDVIKPEDILTNSVYHYNKETKELTKCKEVIKRNKVR